MQYVPFKSTEECQNFSLLNSALSSTKSCTLLFRCLDIDTQYKTVHISKVMEREKLLETSIKKYIRALIKITPNCGA